MRYKGGGGGLEKHFFSAEEKYGGGARPLYPLLGSTPIGPGVVAIPVALVTTVVILSAPTILVFASGNHRSKKFNTGREEAQLFVGI